MDEEGLLEEVILELSGFCANYCEMYGTLHDVDPLEYWRGITEKFAR